MTRSVECTFVVIITLLFCFPCFALENKSRVFDTDYFTINIPAHMRQLSNKEMPPIGDRKSLSYTLSESNKAIKRSILLVIIVNKIDNRKQNALDEISQSLRDFAAKDSECRSYTSKLMETRIAGRKGYFFQKNDEGCTVAFEKYWVTTNSNHAFTFYLARPVKGDDAVFKNVEKEIVKVKLK